MLPFAFQVLGNKQIAQIIASRPRSCCRWRKGKKAKATPAAASERGEVITDLMMALLYTAMQMWHSIALAGKYQFQNPDRQTDCCCPAALLLVISA